MGRPRGRRPLTDSDWPFGSSARRALLRTVLTSEEPEGGWTTYALEKACGVTDHGLGPALPGAEAWRLLERGADGRWRRATPEPPIAGPLRELLKIAEAGPPD